MGERGGFLSEDEDSTKGHGGSSRVGSTNVKDFIWTKVPFVETGQSLVRAESLLKLIWLFVIPLLGQLAAKGAATHLLNMRLAAPCSMISFLDLPPCSRIG